MLSKLFRRFCFAAVLSFFSFSVLTPQLLAQQHGVAASVTSHGFGGHIGRAPGVPASVTSHGFFAPNHPVPHPPFRCCVFRHPVTVHNPHAFHNGHQFFPGAVVYAVPYDPYGYYGYDMDDYADAPQDQGQYYSDQNNQQYNDQQYGAGPTVFDRSGPVREYSPDAEAQQPEQPASADSALAAPEPEPPQPSTVLVFKDGHQLEIANYAIVGDTLFDLTPGHQRRVPLSELDMNATQKQNDNRGSDFRLPGL
jgi:hypothetical protein